MSGKLNGRLLSDEEVKRIAIALADELEARALANAPRSRRTSTTGIAAPVEGDDRCDEVTNRGSMARISTEDNGDCMSLQEAEEDGRRLIEDMQRGISPKPRSLAHSRKRRAQP